MAKAGVIQEFKGPFKQELGNTQLSISGNCKIGISIGEDDFMSLGNQDFNRSLRVFINDNEVWMGRTYIYETGEQVNKTKIVFPNEAPASTIVDVVYCEASPQTES